VAHPFDRFDEIVLGDTEFVSRTGELYQPVCLAYKELRSGRSGALFYDELEPTPPHAHGKNVLYVGFTGAEPEFYLSIGWPFETSFLDLRVEGIHQTNFAYRRGDPQRQKLPRSLISFLRANNILDGDEALKDALRKRIMQGPPFTLEERELILKYCFSDVLLLEKLLAVLLPRIVNFKQALMRGEYVKLTAEMFYHGMPADPWSAGLLRMPEVRQAVRLRAVSDTSLTHGLYHGPTLTQLQMREFLVRHRVKGWRKTASGQFGTSGRDFQRLEQQRPEFDGIADAHKTVTQLHELQLFAGPDGRYRTPIWAFSTITSRAAPNGAAFPFTTPSWCRYTLMPAGGKVLVYLDFASMEFGVAAGLSKAPMMMADYDREPYLTLPILASFLPRDATRHTHGDVRDRYKPMILAVQYGGGGGLLARRLGLNASQGQRIVDLHHDRYEPYWEWSDRKLQHAFDEGELIARDGWRCGINTRTSVFTARNWLVQTNAAALFRYAGLLMRQLGIRIIAPVHDAVLIEVDTDQIDCEVTRATYCLERASWRFLHGLTLRVDVKYVYPGERFTDKRGEKTWVFVERSLRELEEGRRDAVR
jgi:DNA polymerase I